LQRNFASMVEYRGALYVFGGKNTFFLNDVWKFDLNTLDWTKLPEQGDKRPFKRLGHSTVVYKDAMYLSSHLKFLSQEM